MSAKGFACRELKPAGPGALCCEGSGCLLGCRSQVSGGAALVSVNRVKWIFLPAQRQTGNTHPPGCGAALPSHEVGNIACAV